MNTKNIVNISIYFAIVFLLTFIPYTGYIRVFIFDFTTIPAIIGISIWHLGLKGAISTSLSFGIGSLITSYSTLPNPIFEDPLVSVLPRLLMGISLFLIFFFIRSRKFWSFILLLTLCPILNTFFVSIFIFIAQTYSSTFKGGFVYFISLIYINMIIEISIALIISLSTFSLANHLYKIEINANRITW